jgi:hypothetical protein
VTDESQRRPPASRPEVSDDDSRGAPPGRDPEFELHEEIGEHAKRLATQPGDETRQLGEKLTSGRSDATPFLAMSVVGIWIAIAVAIVLALVVVAIYLA